MRKMIITLTLVMVLSGLVLAATFGGLTDRIEANRAAALAASLSAVFGGQADAQFSELDTPDDAPTIYRATSAGGDELGYAVRLQTQGYGGAISMLVGLDTDLESISGIEVVEHVETPGLGGRITEAEFKEQFDDLRTRASIEYVKNVEPDRGANEVQAISGATITSRAVVTGVNRGVEAALQVLEEQGR